MATTVYLVCKIFQRLSSLEQSRAIPSPKAFHVIRASVPPSNGPLTFAIGAPVPRTPKRYLGWEQKSIDWEEPSVSGAVIARERVSTGCNCHQQCSRQSLIGNNPENQLPGCCMNQHMPPPSRGTAA